MTTFHLDPTAGGTDTGASAANAWSTLQRAIDGTNGTQPAAGDIVLCYGADSGDDETPTAPIDEDGLSGDTTSGPIIFRGVNSAGVDEGTRYNIGGASLSSGTAILLFSGPDETQWENFELHDASGTKDGFAGANYGSSQRHRFINCYSHDNGGDGWDGAGQGLTDCVYIRCRAEGNAGVGISADEGVVIGYCTIMNNTGVGIDIPGTTRGAVVFGSVIHNSTANGIFAESQAQSFVAVIGNVVDSGGADGIEVSSSSQGATVLIGNRITNNTTDGIDANENSLIGWNYFDGNGTAISGTAAFTQRITVDGTNTNTEAGTDTEEGYVSVAGNDFNLRGGATLRATEIDLDGTNSCFVSAGIEPAEPGPVIVRPRRVV